MAATRKKLLLKVLILGDARYVQLQGSMLLLILVTRVVWGRHLSCSVTSKEPTKKATRQLLVWRAVHECVVTIALTPTPQTGADFMPKDVVVRDHLVTMQIWDTGTITLAVWGGNQRATRCHVRCNAMKGKGGQRFERLNLTRGVVCSGARQV